MHTQASIHQDGKNDAKNREIRTNKRKQQQQKQKEEEGDEKRRVWLNVRWILQNSGYTYLTCCVSGDD